MYCSILYSSPPAALQRQEPDCFSDLKLDKVFNRILRDEDSGFLAPFFYSPLKDKNEIYRRQEVFAQLSDEGLRHSLEKISEELRALERYIPLCREDLRSDDPWRRNHFSRGRLLSYARRYCEAADALSETLSCAGLRSRALREFYEQLKAYTGSPAYSSLHEAVWKLGDSFSALHYCMYIKNGTIRLKKYEGEQNLSDKIISTFSKFSSGSEPRFPGRFSEEPHAAHVEAGVLQCLSRIYPQEFEALESFSRDFICFEDENLMRFAEEIRFYLSWLSYTQSIRDCGLKFCCPELCTDGGRLYASGLFDIALAKRAGPDTVINDFYLEEPERMIVVTGPNQGGKTTFARAVGQLHLLAALGLTVPGSSARLMQADNVLCHFQREEEPERLSGQLQQELIRLRELLDRATGQSLFIINEIFSSTTLEDALSLGRKMMDKIAVTGAMAVIVTFIDALARRGEDTVSMTALCSGTREDKRSYRLCRRPPDGLARAASLASQYGLSYGQLTGRFEK